MQLKYEQGKYILDCRFDERFTAKNAGLQWDGQARHWSTSSADIAYRLIAHATPEARIAIAKEREASQKVMAMSNAAASEFQVKCPEGVAPFPFQKAGVEFALRNRPIKVLFGDEMGLGKTVQAILIINSVPDIKKVLVVCPASLKINWRRELERWLTRDMHIWIVNSGDTLPDADIWIVNYDILDRMAEKFQGMRFDLVVADEAHRLKNPKTKTYKAFKLICDARHRVCLTGTPILNRPIEIQTMLGWLDKADWGNRWAYAKRYCDLKQTRFGIDDKGASNLDELARRLRSSLMVRRLKKDVLKELPPKLHQVIELPANGLSGMVDEEWKSYRKHESVIESLKVAVTIAKAAETDAEYLAAIDKLKHGAAAAFAEMSKARLMLAQGKIPYVIAHIEQVFEDTDKLVAFGHHTDIISEVVSKMAAFNPVCITGQTSISKRDEAVQLFQNNPDTKLFVGNIIAAGVGLTLTAASTVVMFELDWRPGIVAQAIDRCHRIGQTSSVLAQYLVVEGSLDAYMAKKIAEKQKVIDQALGTQVIDNEDFEIPTIEASPAQQQTPVVRKEIIDSASRVKPGDMEIAIAALRIISGFDRDYAASKNDVGFSKMDVQIGHSLSEKNWLSAKQIALAIKLANRYRGQLPDAESVKAVYDRLYRKEDH